jgi:1-acyl-sn-glycerol-3-phosphate acyltransferase
MKFKIFFVTTMVWLVCILSMITFWVIFFVLWIFTFPFDRKHLFTQKLTWYWATFYVVVYPFWEIELIDKHKLIRGKPCIVVSNHQSLLDIMILFHLYGYFTWVSKIENFRMPVLGWVMTINGYICVNRKDPKTFPKMFTGIEKALKKNKTIMIFPEGTRSLTSGLGRFKDGAFKAAVENKVPIVPIVLDGTGRLLPKDGMKISGKTKIIVKVLDEIPYANFPSNDHQVLREYVKDIMAKELIKLRTIN